MTLTTSQKAFMAILGLAGTAFLVDRFVLAPGGPEQAGGSPEAAAPPSGAPAPAQKAAPQGEVCPSAGAGAALADRLKALAEAAGGDPAAVRDAFTPSQQWLQRSRPSPDSQPAPKRGQLFSEQHRLTSVFLSGAAGYAIVNNKVITVGQDLDGYRLVALTQHSAVFQAGDERVELRLQPDEIP